MLQWKLEKSVRNLIKCIQVAESWEKIQVAILSLEFLPEDISGFNRHILFSEEYQAAAAETAHQFVASILTSLWHFPRTKYQVGYYIPTYICLLYVHYLKENRNWLLLYLRQVTNMAICQLQLVASKQLTKQSLHGMKS